MADPKKPHIDWTKILIAFFGAIVAVSSAWTTFTMSRMAVKVDNIEHYTDGTVTEFMKNAAIHASNLEVATQGKPDHAEKAKLAAEAWEAYNTRVRMKERTEKQ